MTKDHSFVAPSNFFECPEKCFKQITEFLSSKGIVEIEHINGPFYNTKKEEMIFLIREKVNRNEMMERLKV